MDIIATNNYFFLKRYLKTNNNNAGFYACFSLPSVKLKTLMKKYGIQPVDGMITSSSRKEMILNDHVEVIGRLGKWNGHILHWWMTDISSKNVYCSPLLQPLKEMIYCIDAAQAIEGKKRKLYIFGLTWPVIIALKHVAFYNKWNLKLLFLPWSRIIEKLHGKAKAWIAIFKSALSILVEIAITNKCYGHKPVLSRRSEPIYLIKSFVYPDSFDEDGRYKDPFFGDLAEYLTEKLTGKAKVITVALGFTYKKDCYKKMRGLDEPAVVPFEAVLCYRDVVKWLFYLSWMLVSRSFRVKENIKFLEHDITGLLRELLASGGWRIPFYQYIYYAASERLVRKNNIVACALTHESNPWERAFIAGIRKHSPSTRIIGYQHSVIHMASANMFQSREEMINIPIPDVLLTTGVIPANILRKYGAFPKERIKVSCALRYDYLNSIKIQPRRRLDGHARIKIMVALCGVIETLDLVRYTIKQASLFQNIDFLIRAHPVLPFEQLQLSCDDIKSLPKNIRVSKGSTVMNDIMDCDAILYWGSSVALEGIRIGKPVIHFHQDDFLSYDPLFELTDFKWVVNPYDDIMSVLNQIDALTEKKYEELRNSARSYVISYHNPVNNNSLSPFLEL